MVERVLIAAGLIGLGIAAWIVVNRVSVRRLASLAPADPLLKDVPSGIPAILYFTTPYCVPCRTLQQPALAQLQAELGASIRVVQIDANEQPDAADRWGVFSAPTTFILDGTHRPRHVNRGVASAETLKKQLNSISEPSAALAVLMATKE
jgi:thiol-disulfide isomerase/thioredoxin